MSGIRKIEVKWNSCSQGVHQRPNFVDISDVSTVMWCHAVATAVGPIHSILKHKGPTDHVRPLVGATSWWR